MRSRLAWVWAQFTDRLWLRTALFGLAALLSALLSVLVAPLMPGAVVSRVNVNAVTDLLQIMASSMLVVATFSLASLVTALTVATTSATPRAARVLIDDRNSQNALATFVGAFVFSIIGLIGLKLGYYSDAGLAVMMGATILMILAVIVTLFAWIDYLANLMRVDTMLQQLETRAEEALCERARYPCLGGVPATGERGGHAVLTRQTGYVQHLDVAALQKVAARNGGTLRVLRLPGSMVDPVEPLAETSWKPDAEGRAYILEAFQIGAERSFDQDPRFCLSVIAEVASRALSSGINDPGTAIGAIGRLQRLLTLWAMESAGRGTPECPNVVVPQLCAEDLIDDAFGPLTRDAAGMIEVGLRLQKALVVLSRISPERYAEPARALSRRALAQAEAALVLDSDHDRLAAIAGRVGQPAPEAKGEGLTRC